MKFHNFVWEYKVRTLCEFCDSRKRRIPVAERRAIHLVRLNGNPTTKPSHVLLDIKRNVPQVAGTC